MAESGRRGLGEEGAARQKHWAGHFGKPSLTLARVYRAFTLAKITYSSRFQFFLIRKVCF